MVSPTRIPSLQQDDEGRIQFRVRLGVTGHRTIIDSAIVSAKVVDRLQEVREAFSPAGETPVAFTVLTALAEGADRLVAEEARKVLGDGAVELTAVLPLITSEYLDDFEEPGSEEHFNSLLKQSTTTIRLAKHRTRSKLERDAAYDRAGRYIVDRSDVVIAVWDGRAPGGRGGTADIVSYAREQGVPVLVVPAQRRHGEPALAHDDPAPLATPRFRESLEACRRMEEYNRASAQDPRLRQLVDETRKRIAAPLSGSAIHWKLELVADWAVPRFARADLLALHHQRWYRLLMYAIHLLAAAAVVPVAMQLAFGVSRWWLLAEIGFMFALVCAVWIGRRGRRHDRWIGYRSLAEAFRSALFVAMTGTRRRHAPDPADHEEVSERWHQRAFTEAWRARPSVQVERQDATDLRRLVVEAWIDDQVAFHTSTARRCRRRRTQFTYAIVALAALTISVAALHIAEWPPGDASREAFAFLAITVPGFGAALTGLREHGQYRVHEERSRRTISHLAKLKRQLERAEDLATVRRLTAETQRVIEAENLDWFGVLEFQDLEMMV